MSTECVDTVRRMYDGFARGDLEAVLQPCSAEVQWYEAENFIYADRNPYIGPQAVLEGVFLRIAAEWNEFIVEPLRFLDAGDTTVVHGYYSGSYKRTGKRVRAQFAHLFTFRGSELVTFQQFTDTAQFLRAVAE